MKKFRVVVNGDEFEVEVEELSIPRQLGQTETGIRQEKPVSVNSSAVKAQAVHSVNEVTAPLPGNITDIKVAVGDSVKAGDVLMILEAMKMENEIVSPLDGEIKELHVQKGQIVPSGELLLVLR